jgi:hypothetical protein
MNETDWSYNVLEVEDSYVIAGNSIVYSGNIYWSENVIAKINLDGQLQSLNYYGEDSVDYWFLYTPDCLIHDQDHYYAARTRRKPASNWVHQEGTLMKLNGNFDSVWMKSYGEKVEPYDTAFLISNLQKTNQNELILTGSWMPHGLAQHVYLLKTDTLGNKIWDNSYSYENFYIEGYSVTQTSDTGFIIGCFKQTPGYPYTVDPVIIKTDSLGNKEWNKNLGGPQKDFTPMVAVSSDGNIIIGTSIADSMLTPDIPISRINFVKLDNQGNIIWSKKYGLSQPNNFLRKIRVLEDGSIIGVGAVLKYNPEPDRVGWILKTTSEGDSLWYREYTNLTGYESRNYLYDVIETNDNGLIACGYVDPYPPDTGSIDTWIIKLDSIGCDTAGCDTTVGIGEHGGMGAWEQGGLEIFPNPASGEIHVRMNMDDGRSNSHLTLDIYDIFGRTAPTPALPHSGEGVSWVLNVNELPPGIYLAVVREKTNVVARGKFVVVRK